MAAEEGKYDSTELLLAHALVKTHQKAIADYQKEEEEAERQEAAATLLDLYHKPRMFLQTPRRMRLLDEDMTDSETSTESNTDGGDAPLPPRSLKQLAQDSRESVRVIKSIEAPTQSKARIHRLPFLAEEMADAQGNDERRGPTRLITERSSESVEAQDADGDSEMTDIDSTDSSLEAARPTSSQQSSDGDNIESDRGEEWHGFSDTDSLMNEGPTNDLSANTLPPERHNPNQDTGSDSDATEIITVLTPPTSPYDSGAQQVIPAPTRTARGNSPHPRGNTWWTSSDGEEDDGPHQMEQVSWLSAVSLGARLQQQKRAEEYQEDMEEYERYFALEEPLELPREEADGDYGSRGSKKGKRRSKGKGKA